MHLGMYPAPLALLASRAPFSSIASKTERK
jgi:hypothetical protein